MNVVSTIATGIKLVDVAWQKGKKIIQIDKRRKEIDKLQQSIPEEYRGIYSALMLEYLNNKVYWKKVIDELWEKYLSQNQIQCEMSSADLKQEFEKYIGNLNTIFFKELFNESKYTVHILTSKIDLLEKNISLKSEEKNEEWKERRQEYYDNSVCEKNLINFLIKESVSINEADTKTSLFSKVFNFTGDDFYEFKEKYVLTLDISNIGKEEITKIKISDLKIGPYARSGENSCDFDDLTENAQAAFINDIIIPPNGQGLLKLVFETVELNEETSYYDILAMMDITIYSKDTEVLFEVGIFMTKEKEAKLEGSYIVENLIINPLEE